MNFAQQNYYFFLFLQIFDMWICKKNVLISLSYEIVRKSKHGTVVKMEEGEIRSLCLKAREIFLSQPNLLELEAPIKVCG